MYRRRAIRSLYRQSANRPIEAAVSWLAVFTVVAFIVAITFMAVSCALAHDDADWIRKHGYRNMVGELCCGAQDCSVLADGDVRIVAGGYYIKSLKELVPFEKSLPAPSEAGGRYWRCAWAGARKCFFSPPGSS